MNEKEVHICPLLMCTVIWEDGKCTEVCDEEDCPIFIEVDCSTNKWRQILRIEESLSYHGTLYTWHHEPQNLYEVRHITILDAIQVINRDDTVLEERNYSDTPKNDSQNVEIYFIYCSKKRTITRHTRDIVGNSSIGLNKNNKHSFVYTLHFA